MPALKELEGGIGYQKKAVLFQNSMNIPQNRYITLDFFVIEDIEQADKSEASVLEGKMVCIGLNKFFQIPFFRIKEGVTGEISAIAVKIILEKDQIEARPAADVEHPFPPEGGQLLEENGSDHGSLAGEPPEVLFQLEMFAVFVLFHVLGVLQIGLDFFDRFADGLDLGFCQGKPRGQV